MSLLSKLKFVSVIWAVTLTLSKLCFTLTVSPKTIFPQLCCSVMHSRKFTILICREIGGMHISSNLSFAKPYKSTSSIYALSVISFSIINRFLSANKDEEKLFDKDNKDCNAVI